MMVLTSKTPKTIEIALPCGKSLSLPRQIAGEVVQFGAFADALLSQRIRYGDGDGEMEFVLQLACANVEALPDIQPPDAFIRIANIWRGIQRYSAALSGAPDPGALVTYRSTPRIASGRRLDAEQILGIWDAAAERLAQQVQHLVRDPLWQRTDLTAEGNCRILEMLGSRPEDALDRLDYEGFHLSKSAGE